MKNDKTKLIIWATVALVIGVIIGAFLIGPMTTTGEAKAALISKGSIVLPPTPTIKTFFQGDGDGIIVDLEPIIITIDKEEGFKVQTGTCYCDNGSSCPGSRTGNVIDCTCCPEKNKPTDLDAW